MIQKLIDFIESITDATGPYRDLDGHQIVADAYKVLAALEERVPAPDNCPLCGHEKCSVGEYTTFYTRLPFYEITCCQCNLKLTGAPKMPKKTVIERWNSRRSK